MTILPKLSLELSDRCNIRCAHCCTDAKPENSTVLSKEQLLFIVQSIEKTPIRYIGISGSSEPFLFFENLLFTLIHLKKIDCSTRITTNGSWAKSYTKTSELLGRIAPFIDRLDLSYDPYHEAFIPKERILYAVQTAFNLGIPTIIQTVHKGFSQTAKEEATQRLQNLFPQAAEMNAQIQAYPEFHIGRALTLPTETSNRLPDMNTCIALRSLSLDAEGYLYPCCSGLNTYPNKRFVSLGNVFEVSLKELVARAGSAFLPAFYHHFGPGKLIEILEKKYGKETLDPLYRNAPKDDSCFLCWRLLHHPLFKTLFPEGMKSTSLASSENRR